MTPIAAVADAILANPTPSPVLLLDTCSLLDLFRRDGNRPRVEPAEIAAAAGLSRIATASPALVHLVVPELVPREYAGHADRIESEFAGWLRLHDENQSWLVEAARSLGLTAPASENVRHLGLHSACRTLADELLAKAMVLARDQDCLDRAVARLIDKRRPSHKKEVKDSMNLEQSLELSHRLKAASFPTARILVSSNVQDFANPPGTAIHFDLDHEFKTAGLEYFTSLESALGSLRARNQIP